MATAICHTMPPSKPCRGIFFLLFFVLAVVPAVLGQADANKIFSDRAEKEFLRTRAAFIAAPDDPTNCWQFARACFDWADFSTNDTQRAKVAQLGITAARRVIAHDARSAPGHYYLAMDCGQLAQAVEPSVQAFHLVREIEREFKIAAGLDEHLDFAGPARNLGLLYRDAPSWPLSVGNQRKAREYLEQAVDLDPEYPANPLNLAESQLRWNLLGDMDKTLQKLDTIWPAAQTNLTGTAWEQSWDDWTPRRAAIEATFHKDFKHAP